MSNKTPLLSKSDLTSLSAEERMTTSAKKILQKMTSFSRIRTTTMLVDDDDETVCHLNSKCEKPSMNKDQQKSRFKLSKNKIPSDWSEWRVFSTIFNALTKDTIQDAFGGKDPWWTENLMAFRKPETLIGTLLQIQLLRGLFSGDECSRVLWSIQQAY